MLLITKARNCIIGVTSFIIPPAPLTDVSTQFSSNKSFHLRLCWYHWMKTSFAFFRRRRKLPKMAVRYPLPLRVAATLGGFLNAASVNPRTEGKGSLCHKSGVPDDTAPEAIDVLRRACAPPLPPPPPGGPTRRG